MTGHKNEPRQKELEEENELLLLQLHQVQEELERYFLKCQELEKGTVSAKAAETVASSWVDDELPETLAEMKRLKTLVEVQARVHQIEARNALNARLGNLLIESVGAGGSLVALPVKLLKIWRQSAQQQAPESLGGKDYSKVIAAYDQGGFDAVDALLGADEVFPAIKANAWTALARNLISRDPSQAAEAAHRAYHEDPKPFRLKLLAFRLHEAGSVEEADAMLDLLPPDTSFSDSESRQVTQLRYKAKQARLNEAKKRSCFEARRQAVENQIRQLEKECNDQKKIAAARAVEIEELKAVQAQVEAEKASLAARQEETEKLAAARLKQINELQQQIQPSSCRSRTGGSPANAAGRNGASRSAA
jgi:hypothetical protein